MSENYVIISNLTADVEYQFQVVVMAVVNGDLVMGERSNVFTSRPTSPPVTVAVTNTMETGTEYIAMKIIQFALV